MEHFFGENSHKICLKCIFSKACSSNASKMHKIGYMRSPRGSQDASRTAQDGFCLRLGHQLRAKLEPCWPLFPPKTVPWRLLDDPKSAPRSNTTWARDQNRGTPSAQVGYPIGPGGILVDFWSILVDFWSMFGWFFDQFVLDFCSIFYWFCWSIFVDFWSIFNRFRLNPSVQASKTPTTKNKKVNS